MSIRSFITAKYRALGLSERSGSVAKNIGMGFVAKGLSILISFIQIPLILTILDKTEYGIWITIFSVTGWLSFFDIGMGNGFRNQLTQALSVNDSEKAKRLVSTVYLGMFAILSIVVGVFIVASFYIPWTKIFNAPAYLEKQLYYTVVISISATAFNLVASLIHIILAAKHQTGKSSMLFLIGQLLVLLFIIFYKGHQSNYDFLIMSIILTVVPLLVNIGINIQLFFTGFNHIAPKLKLYTKNYFKGLMNLGVMFFIIQISALIIYATDSFMINKLFGPEEVTAYSIVHKYFSVVLIAFSIITTPLWTMYVDSFTKNDFVWVERNIKWLLRLAGYTALVLIIMNIAAPMFFKLWIGKDFKIQISLNVLLSIYLLIYIWGNIWVLPLNAAGKIRFQMFVSVTVAILNIPAILFFAKIVGNTNGVVIGNIFCLIIGCVGMYIYYKKKISSNLRQLNNLDKHYDN